MAVEYGGVGTAAVAETGVDREGIRRTAVGVRQGCDLQQDGRQMRACMQVSLLGMSFV